MLIRFMYRILILLIVVFNGSLVNPARAQLYLEPFVTGVFKVTDITNCGDARVFIVEQAGRIRAADPSGNLDSIPFLDITQKVNDGSGEQGLLGLAFSPTYNSDRRFYVNYTNASNNTVIARYRTLANNPALADTGSEEILFTVAQPFTNHNGGAMHFGPDGYLYLSLGDGGSGGDPFGNGQNLATRLGKLLRIDVDVPSGYAIPPDNPFLQVAGADSTIWNYGLRNMWRFSFDRLTGDKWLADVGQGQWEEINFQAAASAGGENYGWRCYEGDSAYNLTGCQPASEYVFPVYTYGHPAGCSVTGGYVYRGGRYASFYGKYFFVDYCSGLIQSLKRTDPATFVHEQYGLFGNVQYTTFGEDVYGELYIGKGTSGVFRIADSTCTPVAQFANVDTLVFAGNELLLQTPYHPGFSYQWFYNGVPVAGALQHTFIAGLSGTYQVLVMSDDSCINRSRSTHVLLSMENAFGIFPNPGHEAVELVWSLNLPGSKELTAIDMAGRVVYRQEIPGGTSGTTLNIRQWAKGVYAVRIRHAGNTYVEKLVKQ